MFSLCENRAFYCVTSDAACPADRKARSTTPATVASGVFASYTPCGQQVVGGPIAVRRGQSVTAKTFGFSGKMFRPFKSDTRRVFEFVWVRVEPVLRMIRFASDRKPVTSGVVKGPETVCRTKQKSCDLIIIEYNTSTWLASFAPPPFYPRGIHRHGFTFKQQVYFRPPSGPYTGGSTITGKFSESN